MIVGSFNAVGIVEPSVLNMSTMTRAMAAVLIFLKRGKDRLSI